MSPWLGEGYCTTVVDDLSPEVSVVLCHASICVFLSIFSFDLFVFARKGAIATMSRK